MRPIDVVRRSYDAFSRGDLDAVLADLHPDIEWHQAQGLPHGGLYHGRDEVRRNIFEPLHADWWEWFTATPHEFIDGGDQVVVIGRYEGAAKATGKPLDVPFVHVWTLADGLATRFRQYLDTAGWVDALSI
ncbi:MAG TPA: nuclear transport factor 2 family protein [Gaiellaceae bacterium]|nr:nuclear transport factor 2 family protein [Gaiellaceae bacterium]